MTKEEKIAKIYEKIADGVDDYCGIDGMGSPQLLLFPVMIGDVLDYLNPKNNRYTDTINFATNEEQEIIIRPNEVDLLHMWQYKRKPLEEQSLECIDYVFNLLPKE